MMFDGAWRILPVSLSGDMSVPEDVNSAIWQDEELTYAEKRLATILIERSPRKLRYVDLSSMTGCKIVSLRNMICDMNAKLWKHGWRVLHSHSGKTAWIGVEYDPRYSEFHTMRLQSHQTASATVLEKGRGGGGKQTRALVGPSTTRKIAAALVSIAVGASIRMASVMWTMPTLYGFPIWTSLTVWPS